MTTSIKLGTTTSKKDVLQKLDEVGFDITHIFKQFPGRIVPKHESVNNLYLQVSDNIYNGGFFPSEPGIQTQIEFDDHSDNFPKNSAAVSVLETISKELPGMMCSRLGDNLEYYVMPLDKYLTNPK